MKHEKHSPQSKRNYVRHLIPVTVWLSAVAAVAWLFYVRSQHFEVVGIARGQIRQIASDATGRIQNIAVELFHSVKAGDTVAVVDTLLDNQQTLEVELAAQLSTAKAEIEHLASQLVPTEETMRVQATDIETTRANNSRRFRTDVENARLAILKLQVTIATQRIEAATAETEVRINQKLLEDGAIASLVLDQAKAKSDGLAATIKENERLLEQAQADLKEAEERCTQFTQTELRLPSVDAAMEVIRKKINVQEQTIAGLLKRLDALKSRQAVALTSPIDGVIVPVPLQGRSRELLEQRAGEQVIRRPGEVVAAGEPIVAVADAAPTEIVAYVNEQMVGRIRENMPVDLVTTRAQVQIAKASVADVGPLVELMPQRLWRNTNIPQWGLPIVIKIPPGLSLVPGEMVGVRGL